MRTLLSGAIFLCANVAFAEEPFSSIPFEDACQKAIAEKKVVVIDFYATWCGPCKMLDRMTWTDGNVRAWMGTNSVALKIDGDRSPALCSRYKIKAYPTILFLQGDGRELDRVVGYRDPEEFLKTAKDAIRGIEIVPLAEAPRAVAPMKAQVTDPMRRMQNATGLVQSGKKKEAIEEYLWCFDHGLEASPAFGNFRLSYLLSYIRQLGTHYPPAIEALRDRRDRAEKALLSDNSEPKTRKPSTASRYPRSRLVAATEISAINRELNDQERTARIYKRLMTKGEKDRRILSVLLDEVIDPLIASGEYSNIVAGLPNPLATVEQRIESYRSVRDYEQSNSQDADRRSSEQFKRRALDQGMKIYEALVGVRDSTNAQKIALRLVQLDGSRGIYESLMERARRAGGQEEVAWLMRLARERLESEELTSLEVLATKTNKMY